jgi:hypothetical protein
MKSKTMSLKKLSKEIIRIFMPYGIKKTAEGWESFNREYMKLGDYPETYKNRFPDKKVSFVYEGVNLAAALTNNMHLLHHYIEIPAEVIMEISGEENPEKIFLYNDGNFPVVTNKEAQTDYFEKLNKIRPFALVKTIPYHLNN